MEIVLLKDVKGLGSRGDVCDVGDGYAMNFLIPQKFAADAKSQVAIAEMEKKSKSADRLRAEKVVTEASFADLPAEITVTASANEEGGLFTAVKPQVVVKQLQDMGLRGKEEWFDFDPIKKLGRYDIHAVLGEKRKAIQLCIVEEEK